MAIMDMVSHVMIVGVMGIGMNINISDIMVTNNVAIMSDQFMFRRQSIMSRVNQLASVSFFPLIFVDSGIVRLPTGYKYIWSWLDVMSYLSHAQNNKEVE